VEIIILWLLFSIIVAVIASNKGLGGIQFFLFAAIFSPLIALIVVLVMKSKAQEKHDARMISSGTGRKCPFCAEVIKAEATVCRFCGKDLPELTEGKSQAANDGWI
jgi:hypothetical protein